MTPYWRDELRRLAEVESADGCAISFYFQPETPQDKSHRRETILVRDTVKAALKQLERTGNHLRARADLERIGAASDALHNNHSRAKAIFACAEHGIWKEYELPRTVGRTYLHVNKRFHLSPIAQAVAGEQRATVALIDRENARILALRDQQVTEKESIHNELPRRGRGDGFRGYDGGHLERHVENEALRHFQEVADALKALQAAGELGPLFIGCRAELFAAIGPALHPYIRDFMVRRVDLDPTASLERVREEVTGVLDENRRSQTQGVVREVLGEAQRNGRGSLGLHRVITSLERGEVQTLLMGRDFNAAVVECSHCAHLDTRRVKACAICGGETRETDDATRVLMGHALKQGVEVVYVTDDEEFERAGNVAALLRFRADQNTPAKLAAGESSPQHKAAS